LGLKIHKNLRTASLNSEFTGSYKKILFKELYHINVRFKLAVVIKISNNNKKFERLKAIVLVINRLLEYWIEIF